MAYNNRCGKYFVAYKGEDVRTDAIQECLEGKYRSEDFDVKWAFDEDLKFAKIVLSMYSSDRDPFQDGRGNTFVSGYNQEEFGRIIRDTGADIGDEDRYHTILPLLYYRYQLDFFKKINGTHTCTVFSTKNGDLIGGVTTPNNQYTHLYYGYTSPNNEIMFSNNKDILNALCHDVKEMPENTYMKNGTIYNFDGVEFNSNEQLIRNTKENADSLILGLNKLLVQVTNEAVRDKIEKNIEEYLNSDDPKKRILDYIVKELDAETQRQILEVIKTSIKNNNVEETIDSAIHTKFEEKLDEYTKKIQLPIVHIIKLKDTVLGQTSGGFYHEKFDEILSQVQLEEPVLLIGPAGSGKNHCVKQVADALGLHMYYTNNASNEFKLTGFIDAGGNYRDTEFYKAFKNGGLFCLDELDASDPTALIVINSALANGYMAFPHETIDRHKDFRIVAAANTWGKGADMQYVGRNALDGATLDRFDNIYMDYDRTLERNLYPNERVLEFMWSFRDAVDKSKVHHIVSTRGIGKVYKKDANNFPVEQILRTNVVRNLSQDDLNSIIGNMSNISRENKYFDGVKKLRLTR